MGLKKFSPLKKLLQSNFRVLALDPIYRNPNAPLLFLQLPPPHSSCGVPWFCSHLKAQISKLEFYHKIFNNQSNDCFTGSTLPTFLIL